MRVYALGSSRRQDALARLIPCKSIKIRAAERPCPPLRREPVPLAGRPADFFGIVLISLADQCQLKNGMALFLLCLHALKLY